MVQMVTLGVPNLYCLRQFSSLLKKSPPRTPDGESGCHTKPLSCTQTDRVRKEGWDNAEARSAGPGVRRTGTRSRHSRPQPRGAHASLRSENPPERPQLGYLQVSGCALERQTDTLESVRRKLQSESRASCFKQDQKHDPRVCSAVQD